MSGKGKMERPQETEREVRSRRMREQEEWANQGGYMNAKIQKLISKYDSDKTHEEASCQSDIFNSVAIFVNGYTEPSFDVLRKYMIEHGGTFEHYYSATRVTHIIATSLALSKQKLYQNKKVVLPSWITDSVEKKSLQPYEKYLLLGKNRITNFFSPQRDLESLESAENSARSLSVPDPVTSALLMDDIDNPQPSTSKGLLEQDSTKLSTTRRREDDSNTVSTNKSSIAPPTKTGKGFSMLNADEPGFVAEFYGNSRLHHLSHWRMHLKDLVNEIRADPHHHLTGRERLVQVYGRTENLTPLSGELSSLDKTTANSKIYMHLDMDCFFVSVALRNQPKLKDRPVVVAHSKGDLAASNSKQYGSMSQIASCNYRAREAGVRNGMMMGKALNLCPDLQAVPYDFEGYSEVSTVLYQTVASYATEIEAVSCDELYLDISSLLNIVTHEQLAQELRQEIKEKTGCPCSVGMGGNLLLARMATRKAKPDGQFYVSPDIVEDFMSNQKVQDLPGVGRATGRILEKLNIATCSELQSMSLTLLKKEFGTKTGDSLYNLCRGRDDRALRPDQPRQSVSCDVNYGIRLSDQSQVEQLFKNVSNEVAKKLENASLCGKQLTLKLKVRRADAPVESAKFMGHGICDSISKSSGLRAASRDASLLHAVCFNMWKSWNIKPEDLRGVGIQITKLEPTLQAKKIQAGISSYLTKTKKSSEEASGQGSGISTRILVISDDDSETCTDTTLPTIVPEVPSLCNLTRYEDVRRLISRWMDSKPGGPCKKDVTHFRGYMKSLVTSHHLDRAQQILAHLDLLVKRSGRLCWGELHTEVCAVVQDMVSKEYDSSLLLSN